MAILLAFAPFIAFALVDRLVGPLAGLVAGGLVASALLYVPGTSPRAGVAAIILALVGAVKFTGWYPEHGRASAGKP